ncbi:DUF4956 domain-containing protein [Lewinellaceae bacterium SD302]|nr:DUF4956 domain-containing protein [Lewinellaceae bacterium SD302]
MFDFSVLQYNSQYPALTTIIFTVLCSLLLGIMIAFTYDKTSRDVYRPNHFIQAMILITIVAATIMQAIGDSVARGLGMLGALSIIRFRTTLRNPRNIVFMFGAIAAGIACGVLGFSIAIAGTTGLCATAFLLRATPFGKRPELKISLRLQHRGLPETGPEVDRALKEFCAKYDLHEYRLLPNEKKSRRHLYIYHLRLKPGKTGSELSDRLGEIENLRMVSLIFSRIEQENI